MSSAGGSAVKRHSRRPRDSSYTQQRLPAWQPILTPRNIIVTLLAFGVIFLPIGGILFAVSSNVKHISINYTDCTADAPYTGTCADVLKTKTAQQAACRCAGLAFTLEDDWAGPVYLYYGLDNYYQNYRRYVFSRSNKQLHGDGGTDGCSPLDVVEGKAYAPCGFVANSLFNDTMTLLDGNENTVVVSADNIAWKYDAQYKYKNPATWDNTIAPAFWNHTVTAFPDKAAGEGYTNQDLMVWMRPAALPNFRKLYRVIPGGLPKGTYTLNVAYNYPVAGFGGQKRIILSTMSGLGGPNGFLGPAYMAVGLLALLLAVAFFLRVLMVPRRLGDAKYLKWRVN
eukprot:comp23203_c0_seq1/m.37695 comp23203_c0_seq1/g.37695  ORF comp23203_c0_seq1/g.37695 comp23203_c0_seq1/m.37695 type:complete len:340 (-) comp23203_c0_seq1:664-1683(-)